MFLARRAHRGPTFTGIFPDCFVVGRGIDPTMAEAVVEQISQVNPALAADLAALVYDFWFDTLQQLLEQ